MRGAGRDVQCDHASIASNTKTKLELGRLKVD